MQRKYKWNLLMILLSTNNFETLARSYSVLEHRKTKWTENELKILVKCIILKKIKIWVQRSFFMNNDNIDASTHSAPKINLELCKVLCFSVCIYFNFLWLVTVWIYPFFRKNISKTSNLLKLLQINYIKFLFSKVRKLTREFSNFCNFILMKFIIEWVLELNIDQIIWNH